MSRATSSARRSRSTPWRKAPGPVTKLGRAAENTIVLDGTFVSAEHAVIVQRDGGWWLTDRGSTNGTAVNDRPVQGEIGLRQPAQDVEICYNA